MITKIIAVNRRARHDYEILETIEAGIALKGTEVKSCRVNGVSIKEAHIGEMQQSGELYLFNANIPEYKLSRMQQHEPKEPRKLLLHKRQMNKFLSGVRIKGQAIVPLQMYFNGKGLVKIEIALARGKKLHDKRETIKKREWERKKHRELKG